VVELAEILNNILTTITNVIDAFIIAVYENVDAIGKVLAVGGLFLLINKFLSKINSRKFFRDWLLE
jgi:hypothetical protein